MNRDNSSKGAHKTHPVFFNQTKMNKIQKENFGMNNNDFPSLSEVMVKSKCDPVVATSCTSVSYSDKLKLTPQENNSIAAQLKNMHIATKSNQNGDKNQSNFVQQKKKPNQNTPRKHFSNNETSATEKSRQSINFKHRSSDGLNKQLKITSSNNGHSTHYKVTSPDNGHSTHHKVTSPNNGHSTPHKNTSSDNRPVVDVHKKHFTGSKAINDRQPSNLYSSKSREFVSPHASAKHEVYSHTRGTVTQSVRPEIQQVCTEKDGAIMKNRNSKQANAKFERFPSSRSGSTSKVQDVDKPSASSPIKPDPQKVKKSAQGGQTVQDVFFEDYGKSSSKKRKSKIKRQLAFQTAKLSMLTPETHSKIMNCLKDNSVAQPQRNVVVDIFNEEEYPDLSNASVVKSKENLGKTVAMKTPKEPAEPASASVENPNSTSESTQEDTESKESKNANAESTLSSTPDISNSQELPVGKKTVAHANSPITISLFDMILASKVKKKEPENKHHFKSSNKKVIKSAINPLDSTGPKIKRGKERERPKIKKPSRLRKLILLGRQLKRESLKGKESNIQDCNKEEMIAALGTMILQIEPKNDENCETCTIKSPGELTDTKSGLFCNTLTDNKQDINRNNSNCNSSVDTNICTCPESDTNSCDDSVLTENHENTCTEENALVNANNFHEGHEESLTNNLKQISIQKQENIKSECFTVNSEVIDSKDISCLHNNEANSSSTAIDVHSEKKSINRYDESMLESSVTVQNSSKMIDKNQLDAIDLSEVDTSKPSVNTAEVTTLNGSKDCVKVNAECKPIPEIACNKVYSNEEKMEVIKLMLHSRKFRNYCNHFISKEIDKSVFALLDDLARFQDRLHQKDELKARVKRRMVYGIKEIKKHLPLKKIKCIIIATDIEDNKTEGGLNDYIHDIQSLADAHHIPVVFSHRRYNLGKVCRKPVPISCVGIFRYDGSEKNFKTMMELQEQNKQDYAKVTKALLAQLTDKDTETLYQAQSKSPEVLHEESKKLLKGIFSQYSNQEEKDVSKVSKLDNQVVTGISNICKILGGTTPKNDEFVDVCDIFVKHKLV